MKKRRVKIAHSIDTTGTRTNHISFVLKFLDQLFTYLLAVIPVTVLVRRLTAAGLLGIVVHAATDTLQHLEGIAGGFRLELIHVTGNEKIDYHWFRRYLLRQDGGYARA